MGIIYFAMAKVGAESRGLFSVSANGGIALAEIAEHYLGYGGYYILAITVTLACLKTSVGLITSCAETFSSVFKNGPKYRTWVFIFTAVSFLISNVGLTTIIQISVPVLMFLYPYTIVLSILALTGHLYNNSKVVYNTTIAFTTVGSIYDFLSSLPSSISSSGVVKAIGAVLPFSSLGLGWLVPSLIGAVLGLCIYFFSGKKRANQ